MAWPTGATRLVAVIGDPVRHSLSPAMHNAAFRALDLDWAYLALRVSAAQVGPAVSGAGALGLEGLNVTMPHKGAVIPYLSRLSQAAAMLGAVNTVYRAGGEWVGESTDGSGFLDALRLEQGFEPAGRRCMVVGAGGAGRAVVLGLAQAGAASVTVVNRTRERAELAAALAGPVGRVGSVEEAEGADLVVNATPLGMRGAGPGGWAVPPERLGPGQLLVDLVYHPVRTPLVAAAAERGAKAVGGLGMLVHQGAHSFRLWTGERAPIEVMRAAAEAAVAGRAPWPSGSPG